METITTSLITLAISGFPGSGKYNRILNLSSVLSTEMMNDLLSRRKQI